MADKTIRTNETLDDLSLDSMDCEYTDDEINYDWYDNQDIDWLQDYYDFTEKTGRNLDVILEDK